MPSIEGLNNEFINYFVYALAIVLVGKMLGPSIITMINDFVSPKKKQKNIDLDILIEQKKQMMRNGVPEKTLMGKSNTPKASSKETEESYKSHFESLSANTDSDPTELEDCKKILSLFGGLQWGDGPEIQEIQKKLSEKNGLNFPSQEINQTLHLFIKRDFLLSRKTKNLPSFNEIVDLIDLKMVIERLINEAQDLSDPVLLTKYSSKYKLGIKALKMALLESIDSGTTQVKILKDEHYWSQFINEKKEILILKKLKTDDKKFFTKKSDFLKEISEKSIFYDGLLPLPPLSGKDDFQGALNIFNLDEDATMEEVKKRYKKLAILKHPDKLMAKGIPPEFESIATENFANIQSAYDIIVKKLS